MELCEKYKSCLKKNLSKPCSKVLKGKKKVTGSFQGWVLTWRRANDNVKRNSHSDSIVIAIIYIPCGGFSYLFMMIVFLLMWTVVTCRTFQKHRLWSLIQLNLFAPTRSSSPGWQEGAVRICNHPHSSISTWSWLWCVRCHTINHPPPTSTIITTSVSVVWCQAVK